MGFINKYLFNLRLARLQEHLDSLKIEKGKEYQGVKLTKMKNGDLIYLTNCISPERNLGCIYVITRSGADKSLNYLMVHDQYKYMKIGEIRHKIINQGIGTQMLIYLEEIGRLEGVGKITGWISPIELNDHGERLLHFFEKNGYQVSQGKIVNMIIEGLIATKFI
jgi:hypothetical protein